MQREAKIPRRIGELGLEKYCRGCDEWWPEDEEFFGRHATPSGFYLRSTCRACTSEQDRKRRR